MNSMNSMNSMNWYVCKEFDEIFWVEAENDNDAMEKASLYNGVVIREATEEEIFEMKVEAPDE